MNPTCAESTSEVLVAEMVLRGIQAHVCGDQLWLCPLSRVTPDLRERLRENKDAVIRLLGQASPNADERDAWEERVAICMFDGGLSEEDAEVIAWRQIEDERAAAEYEHRRPR